MTRLARIRHAILAATLIIVGITIGMVATGTGRAEAWGSHQLTPAQANSVRVIREVWRPQGKVVVRQALRVSWCESKFKPWADNKRSTAFGVFQRLGEKARRARGQARQALTMFTGTRTLPARHFQPWKASQHCWG